VHDTHGSGVTKPIKPDHLPQGVSVAVLLAVLLLVAQGMTTYVNLRSMPDDLVLAEVDSGAPRRGMLFALYPAGWEQPSLLRIIEDEIRFPLDGTTVRPLINPANSTVTLSGLLKVAVPGRYQFFVSSPTGTILRVNGSEKFSSWPAGIEGVTPVELDLPRGSVHVELSVRIRTVGWVELAWQAPGARRRLMRGSDFLVAMPGKTPAP
jgi:hypothetical protein